MILFMAGVAVMLIGGVLAAFMRGRPGLSSRVGAVGGFAGALLGLAAVIPALFGPAIAWQTAWSVPQGAFLLEVDALSAVFLVPVLVLGLVGAPYGFAYWQDLRGRKLGAAWLFFNWLVAAMMLVAAARNAVLFLVAWELMALAAFFLITLDHEDAGVRSAGWTFLIAAHIGVLVLFALFLTLGSQAHTLDFSAFAALAPSRGFAAVLFLLALVGFGLKAALPGLHVWLPDAHAAAPSHVSALLSGAMLNLGLYGILRVMLWLGPPEAWWGITLIVTGGIGAVLGIGLGAIQRDIKRVLAYSSIENIGLIVAALGAAVWASAHGLTTAASVAATAAFLHMWNHAAMKGLLFLSAGGVVHALGTRDLEQMGGLAKKMPVNVAFFIFGSVAICGLPPLNGFVGEWFLYMGLAQGGMAGDGAANLALLVAVGAVALAGGLAVLTFVRVCGTALLGAPRSPAAEHAHEPGALLLLPIAILALLCVFSAVAPGLVIAALFEAEKLALPDVTRSATDFAANLGLLNAGILAAFALAGLLIWRSGRRVGRGDVGTWGCGYARPSARMQYTARSFSEVFGDRILPGSLRPRSALVLPHGLFPREASFKSDFAEPIRERAFAPLFGWIENGVMRLRWLQQGLLNEYVLHILLFLLGLLLWMSLFPPGGT